MTGSGARSALPNRLALGTAQFGLAYGVANRSGQINGAEAASILECAMSAGVDTLDTAIGYGDSERRLGEIGVGRWQVVTKLPGIPEECEDIGAWVGEAVRGSLNRLRIQRLHGLLLHRPNNLLADRGEELFAALTGLKQAGFVEKIGVSIYHPEELDALCAVYDFDLVQAPFSIIDRRLETSGWLERLHLAGTEIHVRSVFLQGVLLMPEGETPEKFSRWTALWDEWHRWLAVCDLTALQACLGFVLAYPEVDRAIIGIDSHRQLMEVLANCVVQRFTPPASLAGDDPDLLDPRRWKNP